MERSSVSGGKSHLKNRLSVLNVKKVLALEDKKVALKFKNGQTLTVDVESRSFSDGGEVLSLRLSLDDKVVWSIWK